jgi:hypothetical protein
VISRRTMRCANLSRWVSRLAKAVAPIPGHKLGVKLVGYWHQADHFRIAAIPSAIGGFADTARLRFAAVYPN